MLLTRCSKFTCNVANSGLSVPITLQPKEFAAKRPIETSYWTYIRNKGMKTRYASR